MLVTGKKIVALGSSKGNIPFSFSKISFADKISVEAMLEIEDERTSGVGSYSKFNYYL